jgi:2-dehydro-3-deoxy-D-arabinonate dehydratase
LVYGEIGSTLCAQQRLNILYKMKVYKTKEGIVIEKEDNFYLLKEDWDLFMNDDNLFDKIEKLTQSMTMIEIADKIIEKEILAPVGSQELWACGVTYLRSKQGRQEESKEAGGNRIYCLSVIYHYDVFLSH